MTPAVPKAGLLWNSLWADVRAGRWGLPDFPAAETLEEVTEQADWLRSFDAWAKAAKASMTHAVDITACFSEIVPSGALVLIDWTIFPRMTPVFEWMWLEGNACDAPVAIQLHREDRRDGFVVSGCLWERDQRGLTGPSGSFRVELTKDGQRLTGPKCALFSHPIEHRAGFECMLFGAFHAIAKLHCKNVHMEPIASPKAARRLQYNPTPATVFHRIVVTDAPRNLSGGHGVLGRDDTKMRQYSVKGHYRHAPSHPLSQFRGPFWIPDHWRGNEELGQVLSEYAIQ
jgi:hypothetical protein